MNRKTYQNAVEAIGDTPLVELQNIARDNSARVLGKLESANPGGSVKDRIGRSMLQSAEAEGKVTWGQTTIIEPTSGNTGIGLALVAAAHGNPVILTMPESMSAERRSLLAAYGARLVLTPAEEGMNGAITRATELLAELEDAYMPNQFENPANPAAHEQTTGPEIWDATGGKVDAFVAGVGTGGTITGVGRYLKSQDAGVTLIAVEPAESAVISGEKPGKHGIQGIGAGFIPPVLDTDLLDDVRTISRPAAVATAREMATKEGILCGISAGANVKIARDVAAELGPGDTVVTVICDTGERYLSTDLFDIDEL